MYLQIFSPSKTSVILFFFPGVKLTGQIKSSSFFPPKFLPTQISHMKKIDDHVWNQLKFFF